jgi:phosphoserine aminotransferase
VALFATSEFFDMANSAMSKNVMIYFFDVLYFATTKNFDMAFLTCFFQRQKLCVFFFFW